MEAFLVSVGCVAIAEFGDKSQMLVLALASRFRKPIPIVLGMFAATSLNHALAAESGAWLAAMISPRTMRWTLGLSLAGIAFWSLMPKKQERATTPRSRFGVFGTTLVACFLMEMGDKTQFATIALAANYGSFWAVVVGSTVGLMLVDVPVVMLGTVVAQKLPQKWLHGFAPALFLVLGIVVLVTAGVV